MAVLGGTLFPIQAMPASLQKIAMLSPTYWFHEGIMLAKNGGLFAEQLTPLGILLLFAIAFMLIGAEGNWLEKYVTIWGKERMPWEVFMRSYTDSWSPSIAVVIWRILALAYGRSLVYGRCRDRRIHPGLRLSDLALARWRFPFLHGQHWSTSSYAYPSFHSGRRPASTGSAAI